MKKELEVEIDEIVAEIVAAAVVVVVEAALSQSLGLTKKQREHS